MRTLVCLLLCSSSIAFAGHGDGALPTRVSIGPPKGGAIDRVAVTARSHLGHLHVTLVMDLSSRAADMTEVALPLRLSTGASVIGMTLGEDAGKTYDPEVARSRYEQTVRMIRDPALLEQKAPGRYALAVFPVARAAGAKVTIELALPHGAPLLLEGVRTATLDLDGTPRRLATARPVSLADALEERRDEGLTPLVVDAEISLLALPPQYDPGRRPPVPNLSGFHEHISLMPTTKDLVYVRDRDVATAVDENEDALRHCFALSRRHSASLVLSIAASGAVESVRVDDLDHAATAQCIADQVTTWKFAATQRSRTFRHALEL